MRLQRIASLLGFSTGPVSPAQGYALWADAYPAYAHNALMTAEDAAVSRIVAELRPDRVLDVGTGTGRNVARFAGRAVRTVVGVDLSAAMLANNTSGRPLVRADACALPFPSAHFDLVLSSLMAGDVEAIGTWVAEAARVLAPGGHLVYSDFHPSWGREGWRRTFTAADGRKVEMAFFAHELGDHIINLTRASMKIVAIREPRIDAGSAPVLAVFHAVKGGHSACGTP